MIADDRLQLIVAGQRASSHASETPASPCDPAFRGKNLKHFALVVHGAPEVMRLPVDAHEHFVQMLAPVRV